jgi:hypothetical protein
MQINWRCNGVRTGKYLSNDFPIQNGQKQGDALTLALFNSSLQYNIKEVKEDQVVWH